MKISRILFIAFIAFLLSGCIKEALMLDTLKGKWTLNNKECFVTPSEDVSYLDLYSKPWTGTVTINGVEQNCEHRVVSMFFYSYLYLSPDLQFYYYPPTPKIIYKTKLYDSSISWELFITGIINKELIFTADNNTVNIKIDLRAPITYLKKGVEYAINDSRWEEDIRIDELEFLSPTRITGSFSGGDIIIPFDGKWYANSSEITFKIGTESDKIVQTYRYFYNNQELTLYKYIDFAKINTPGTIPYDKISKVKQVIKYIREN